MVYTRDGIFLSYKKKEVMTFVGKWMHLEIITLGHKAVLRKTNIMHFLLVEVLRFYIKI